MIRPFTRQPLLISATVVAMAAVFLLDCWAELGMAGGVPYVAAIWLAYASGHSRFVWIVAGGCSLLTLIGWGLSPAGSEFWSVLLNRLFALCAIWLIAQMSVRTLQLRRKSAERAAETDRAIAELHRHRDAQEERTRALMRVMEDLRVTQRQYQDLYDNSPEYYASVNVETAVIEHCNLTLSAALGIPREEIVGRPLFELYHPTCLEKARNIFAEFRETGSIQNASLQLKRHDGTPIDVILNMSAVRDASDRIVRSRSVWRDVTKLRRAEARFERAVESLPTAMVMVDSIGRIVLVNAETEKLFGYARRELIGRPVEILVPDRFRGKHPRLRDGFFAAPAARPMGAGRDLFGLHKDGSEFPVEIGLNPIETEEGLYVLSAVVDITERKRVELKIQRYAVELERSNRELDQFAYSASHDLKAPLRAIDSLAKWIIEDVGDMLPAESRDDLELMQRRIARMEALLDGLLEYSRVGRVEHKLEEVDSYQMVREVVDLFAAEGFQFDVQSLPRLTTPKAPLEQVFRNLIGNAIKHHDRAEGRIQVRGHDNGRFVEFEVCDDGPGIPPEYQEKVFGMFQTLKPRDQVEGSGMGLALVKKIVQSQGGRIQLESAAGKGATFRFTWPKQDTSARAAGK